MPGNIPECHAISLPVISLLTCCQKEVLKACTCLYRQAYQREVCNQYSNCLLVVNGPSEILQTSRIRNPAGKENLGHKIGGQEGAPVPQDLSGQYLHIALGTNSSRSILAQHLPT